MGLHAGFLRPNQQRVVQEGLSRHFLHVQLAGQVHHQVLKDALVGVHQVHLVCWLEPLMRLVMVPVTEDRVKLLKHLADSSLYIGGFFQESLGRSNVDVDYHVDMGGRAYGQLSGAALRGEHNKWRPVFEELSQKFERLIELLSEMADLNKGLAQSLPGGGVAQ